MDLEGKPLRSVYILPVKPHSLNDQMVGVKRKGFYYRKTVVKSDRAK